MNKQWPEKDKTVGFYEIAEPIIKALKFAYRLRRKNLRKDIPWNGLDIGEELKASNFSPDSTLSHESLRFNQEDQGRNALEVIIGIAVQLGIEQGRRIEVERANRFM